MSSRFDTAEQAADVVAGLALIQGLVEHFDAGDRSSSRASVETDDLDFVADLHEAALDTAGGDGTATFDREHVFDRHQERLVDFADRLGNVGVDRVHQLADALRWLLGSFGLS